MPLTDAAAAIVEQHPGLDELFRRFASPPIRNAATLGGNIANGSPIGDTMPALMAAGTTLLLQSIRGIREVDLEKFYLGYQRTDLQPGEFVRSVRVPRPETNAILRSHKLSKRFDQDISAVCTAYRLQLEGNRVRAFRMACGGLAATVKRAIHCERALAGRRWERTAIDEAAAALADDFAPIAAMREADWEIASHGYRWIDYQQVDEETETNATSGLWTSRRCWLHRGSQSSSSARIPAIRCIDLSGSFGSRRSG